MKNRYLYAIWGGLYVLCALLGCVSAPDGIIKALLVLLSLAFFIPGGLLLYRGIRSKDKRQVSLIRNLSALSLGLTLFTLILNFLSVMASEIIGNITYGFLILVSSPMICSQYWFISLFLWACLLFTSIAHMPKA